MKCLKCGNYESDKSICKNKGLNGEISIEATKIGTGDTAGTSYNTSLSYTNVEVLNNEYINSVEVKINMVENDTNLITIVDYGYVKTHDITRKTKVSFPVFENMKVDDNSSNEYVVFYTD